MIPTQKEAWQSIVDRFPNNVIELGEEILDDMMWSSYKPIIIDGKQIKARWPIMDDKKWKESYNGIPVHAELTAMVYEYIHYHFTGKMGWEEHEKEEEDTGLE